MDLRYWYKGQYPSKDEMREILSLVEEELGLSIDDVRGSVGLLATDIVAHEDSPAGNNVLVPAGAAILDRSGTDTTKVIARWATEQDIDCSVDYLAASTQPGGGKERYLAVFVKYDESESDARTDFDGNPLNYVHAASFAFEVHQTGDANPGTATPVASPGDHYVRVCDILVTNAGWGTINDPADPYAPGDDEIDYTTATFLASPEISEARGGMMKLQDAVEHVFPGYVPLGIGRNAIINGNFDIWQRGTSWTDIGSSGTFTADRWEIRENLATGTMNVTKETTVKPTRAQSGIETTATLKVAVGTTQATTGAAEDASIEQKIEGFNIRSVYGHHCVLSFWVRCSMTGIFYASIEDSNGVYAYPMKFTVDSVDTWERKELEFEFLNGSATWNLDETLGASVRITLSGGDTVMGGSDRQWNASGYNGAADCNDNFFATTNTFYLSQVQLSKGRKVMPFPIRHIADELALCQRYYEKSYEVGTDPGTATIVGMWLTNAIDGGAVADGSSWYITQPRFRVLKRTTPTVLLWDAAGSANQWWIAGAKASAPDNESETGFDVDNNTGGPVNPGHTRAYGHFTADAEL